MKTIALTRLNILTAAKGDGLNKEQQIIFLAELAHLGYRLSKPEILQTISTSFLLDYKDLMANLAQKRGGDVKYVSLFQNFPENTPDKDTYFLKRVLGHIGNVLEIFPDSVVLDNGQKVPKWLFNLHEFGADPISQLQSKELFDAAIQKNSSKKSDTHVEWLDLTIIFEEDLKEKLQDYLAALVYSKSSIKEALHADLNRLLDFLGTEDLDMNAVVFKETKSLLMKYLWNKGDFASVNQFTDTATDVLRLFAALTDSDVSLSKKIKFPKLPRKARKAILNILEKSTALAENLKKYKDLWLEIGRYLHPTEYARQFPRTAAVFDALRNGKIETYESKTEALLALKELDTLLIHLEKKPGTYARKLHQVLRSFPQEWNQILISFEKNISAIALKNLFILKAYFLSINEAEYRTIVNKKGYLKVLPNNALGALNKNQIDKIVLIIQKAINENLAKRETWANKTIWIDPLLVNYTIPLQQRKASDGLITVGKGSRIKIDFTKVLRLFVYWKESQERTDLDLSVIQFDENFNYLGHVSYTNLKSDGIVHSGDIQSAPLGAAEFIDISLDLLDPTVKYLAVDIYKFCGDNFIDMDCHAGWMLRSDTSSDITTFDIKTVANKFDLNGVGGFAIPLIVAVETQEIISTDLYVNSLNFHNNVEGSINNVGIICSQIVEFTKTRALMSDLAQAHITARNGLLTESKEEADITFGLAACTYNATDVELILSELI